MIALLGLALLAGTPASDKAHPTPMPPVKSTPKIELREPENPVVAIRLAFRTGSADDPPGKEGLTALTAELMAQGGTKALSSADLQRALYPMAAELDAVVDREMTVFSGRVHKDNLDKLLKILGDVVLEPRMDPKELDRLKADAINELTLELRTSADEALGKETLETMLAPGHPYGHPPVGTESGLKSLTLQDAIDWRAKAFGSGRLTVGIAGGFDPKLAAAFEKRLAGLPRGEEPASIAAPSAADATNVLIVEKPAKSTAFSMGFDVDVKRGDADFYPLRLAMAWFGEHRQTHGDLFQNLRERRGLNYGDYAYIEKFVQAGGSSFARNNVPRGHQHFEIWIRPVETKNAVFALRAALWRYDHLLKQGLSQEDFERTRSYMMGFTRIWEQTADKRLGLAIDDSYYGTDRYLDRFREAMATMTADQVNAAIRKHLAGRPLQIAAVTGDGKDLQAKLVSGQPSPPVYASPKPDDVVQEDKVIQAWPLGLDAAHVKVVPTADMFR